MTSKRSHHLIKLLMLIGILIQQSTPAYKDIIGLQFNPSYG